MFKGKGSEALSKTLKSNPFLKNGEYRVAVEWGETLFQFHYDIGSFGQLCIAGMPLPGGPKRIGDRKWTIYK